MKTITEYQPLIYSALFAEPSRRRNRRRQTLRVAALAMLVLYFAGSVKIMAETGLAAWNWQFWIIFLPFFALGERVLWSLQRRIEPRTSRLSHVSSWDV